MKSNRRMFLASLGAAATVGLSGCAGGDGTEPRSKTASPTDFRTESPTDSPTESPTDSPTDSPTPVDVEPVEPASSQAFTQFQGGPKHAGKVTTTTPITKEPTKRWSYEVDATSSIQIVGDGEQLYTTNEQSLEAINMSTGERLWRFETEEKSICTPALSSEYIFFLSGSTYTDTTGAMYALDRRNGELIWSNADVQYGFGPTLHRGHLYAGTGAEGTLARIAPKTGEVVWEYQLKGDNPIVHGGTVIGNSIYTIGLNSYLSRVDLQNGDGIWTVQVDSRNPFYTVGTNRIYVSGSYAKEIIAVNPESGEVDWRYSHQGNDGSFSPPVTDGSTLVDVTKNTVYALNTENGRNQWQKDIPLGETPVPLMVGKTVYVPTGSDIRAFDVSTGEVQWTYDASPIYSFSMIGDTLFAIGRERIVALGTP